MQARHKYTVGQQVEFLPGPLDKNVTRGIYTVQRLMPSDTGIVQYRVKHISDTHERVVNEGQLSPSAAPQAVF